MSETTAPLRLLSRLPHALVFLAFCLIGLSLYGHTLKAPFYLDDVINIRDRLYAMTALSLNEVTTAAFKGFAARRPLANLSFSINYYLHGLRLPGYHWVNIVIHILNGALLCLFLFKTLTLPGQRGTCRHPLWVALLSSLLWFVNPVETQAVTYVVQRMTSMATLFFMGAFILYVYGRTSRQKLHGALFFLSSFFCWILSAASKEIAFTLPALVIVYEWLFFQDLNRTWLRKSVAWMIGISGSLAAAAYLFYGYTPVGFFTEVWQPRGFTALERLLTESRVVFFYISLIAFPHPGRLNLNHDFVVSRGLLDPLTTALSIAGLLALLILSVLMLKRYRIIAFCVIWFLANVALEAMAAGIELLFEHRVYLPSMLFFLPFVWLLFRLEKPKLVSCLLLSVVAVFSFWTYQRNALWNDPVAFWQDAVRKSPAHYRGYANLGISYLHAEAYEAAQVDLEKALTLDPPYPTEVYVNLGLALVEQGQFEAARENLNRALSINENNYVALDLLGTVSRREKNYPEAILWYNRALENNPEFVPSYYNLATLHREMGNAEKAIEALQQAIALRPMSANVYSTLGLLRAEQGNFALAEASLDKALEVDAQNTEALFNLARIYELTTRPGLAAKTYQTLLILAPGDIEARHNLALLYLRYLEDVEQGRFHLRRALELDPHYAQADVARAILQEIGSKP
jgi:tetratricopeptide (TPR) repeat protein